MKTERPPPPHTPFKAGVRVRETRGSQPSQEPTGPTTFDLGSFKHTLVGGIRARERTTSVSGPLLSIYRFQSVSKGIVWGEQSGSELDQCILNLRSHWEKIVK